VSSWSSLPQSGALKHTYTKFGKKQSNDYGEKITNMAVSSKNVLAVASTDVIQFWNLPTGREVLSKSCILPDATDSGLAFSPDETLLGAVNLIPKDVGSLVRTISIWDCETGARLDGLSTSPKTVYFSHIASSRDTKLTACSQEAGLDHKVVIYDRGTGEITGFEQEM
jgi:WD40 repeat protein